MNNLPISESPPPIDLIVGAAVFDDFEPIVPLARLEADPVLMRDHTPTAYLKKAGKMDVVINIRRHKGTMAFNKLLRQLMQNSVFKNGINTFNVTQRKQFLRTMLVEYCDSNNLLFLKKVKGGYESAPMEQAVQAAINVMRLG